MIYINKSMLSGKQNSMEFDMTEQEFIYAYNQWKKAGVFIQHAFPNLTPAEREFIKTGITPEEWTSVFGEDE